MLFNGNKQDPDSMSSAFLFSQSLLQERFSLEAKTLYFLFVNCFVTQRVG